MEIDNSIILTKDIKNGEKLHEALSCIDVKYITLKCYTKDDIKRAKDCFGNVSTIFSTWDMPIFTTEEVKSFFPKLKFIFYSAGTVKYFAFPFFENNVRIFSSALANASSVAEFTTAEIILANKGYFQASRKYSWPIWRHKFAKARQYSEIKRGNYNSNIGIIGCGSVGSKVLAKLSDYDLNLYVYDPYVSSDKVSSLGATLISLDEMFSKCDVISNHLPDTSETKGMLNYSLFSKMKPWATFINTGRGAQIVERDLAKVMRHNKNMCALLDVTTHEPVYPWSPLFFCRNVYFSPHIAGSTSNEYARMVKCMAQAFDSVSVGKDSVYEVKYDNLKRQA